MSNFAVTIEKIGKVEKHPNADKLDLATLEGVDYQFVVLRDQFIPGEPCVYFPLDSIIPVTVTDYLGLTGRLCGKAKDRVKTIRLRGSISQGVVAKMDIIKALAGVDDPAGLDLTTVFGVTKYEPEERWSGGPNNTPSAQMNPLPTFVHKYDIENAEKYKRVVDELMDEEVFITEKLEGCHVSLTLSPEGTMILCSRNCTIQPLGVDGIPSHYHVAIANSGLEEVIKRIAVNFDKDKYITIRSEVVGPRVQNNIYRLPRLEAKIFELEVDSTPVTSTRFLELVNTHEMVPILFTGKLRDWLGDKTIKEACTGKTIFGNDLEQLREGVVIKLLNVERYVPDLGRLLLKQRSSAYLEKSDA